MSYEESQRIYREVIAEFRANGGKLGGPYADIDVLLLTTSTDSGSRTIPIGYARDGERLFVFAADNGREGGPNWYHDLLTHPHAQVEVGADKWPVLASVAPAAERKRLWDKQIEHWPFIEEMAAQVPWEIPVVILTAEQAAG
ncbi:nitroreductase/quinone reductase family protein [Nocardia huaxiensis]|uniref:Nitroreductase family deazaflavin-dependent oxidoreductase n=1 Tax=Nocardia huaxiensis TaxID=2755382 RepID=A0A7D6VHM0_9NOCA|nr:nitroreductase/quinone reductase family protein [Nocardia huaxiensis]QLY33057.1 nitroreductase family deazaflavin-dependent oxidoreductase [Nocardia huaxiensis]UFS93178.1 nitroreductase family deazaflavin-dependent oxidoreductase [Nocardia huaxiensis]